MYGACNLSIVPCRKEASDRSEMTTQLLFGDVFTILEETEKWALIKNAYDGYESWIDKKQYVKLSETDFNEITLHQQAISADAISVITVSDSNQVMPLVAGSVLPYLKEGICRIGNTRYLFEGPSHTTIHPTRNVIVENAFQYLNAPYLWGGRSPFGIDCSGFTQIVYRLSGLKILRDAYEQATQGKVLSFVEEAQPGDLAFFDNEDGKIVHVGIIVSEGTIIHASGKVRIDVLDHNGIFNQETKKYTHRLRVLKTYL
jgi:gamma-D-glutamyl-L-lysine dipeptidyl-peptidase